jgi:hypothetical protein
MPTHHDPNPNRTEENSVRDPAPATVSRRARHLTITALLALVLCLGATVPSSALTLTERDRQAKAGGPTTSAVDQRAPGTDATNASGQQETATTTPTVTGSGVPAVDQDDSEGEPSPTLPPRIDPQPLTTEPNGVPIEQALALFSRDRDGQRDTGEPFYERALGLASRLGGDQKTRIATQVGRYRQGDQTFARPQSSVRRWSLAAYQTLTRRLAGTNTESHRVATVPSGAETEDGQYLKDAHATIHALGPQTIVHGDRGTDRYIAPRGSVQGLVDYRVEVPDDRVEQNPAGNIVRQTYEYELVDHRIESVTLATNAGTQTTVGRYPTFQYDYARGEKPGRFVLRASLSATVKRTVTTVREVEEKGDFDGDNETETRTVRETTTTVTETTDTLTVDDQRSVEVYRLVGVSALYAPLPADRVNHRKPLTALSIGAEVPWAGYTVQHRRQIQSGSATDRVHTRWRFYSASDRDWRRLQFRAADDDASIRTPARMRPVVMHAVRVPGGLAASPDTDDGGPGALRALGRLRGASQDVSEHVSVSERLGQTRATARTITRHQATVNADVNNRVRVYGLVAGTGTTVRVAEMDRREVRKPTLSVEAVASEGRTTTLEVTLTDGNGNPVSLSRTASPVFGDRAYASPRLRQTLRGTGDQSIAAPSLSDDLADQTVTAQNPEVEPFSIRRPAVYVTATNTDDVVAVPLSDLRDDGTATVTVQAGGGRFIATFYPRPWTEVPREEPAYIGAEGGTVALDLFELRDWGAGLFQLLVWALPYAVMFYLGRKIGDIFRIAEGPRR